MKAHLSIVFYVGALAMMVAGGTAQAASVDFESAPASGYYTLRNNGSATTTMSTDYAVSPTHSAMFYFPDADSTANDNPTVKVWYTGQLGNTAASFATLVTSGSSASVPAPYLMFGVDVNGDGLLTSMDPSANADAYVIAFIHPTFSQGQWFTTGLDASTMVQVVGNRAGLTAGTFSASGTQDTLADLDAISTGNGAQTWGSLNILAAYVGAGEWPGMSGSYTAYVDNISVSATPEPASLGLLALGGLTLLRRKRR